MRTNLVVVDDFYNNAAAVREFVLRQDFSVSGNYPGRRTRSHATEELKGYFEALIDRKISLFETTADSYNGAFQYTTAEMDSWVHRDTTDWAGILYLTPDAPVGSGTAFYRHKATGLEEFTADTPEEIQRLLDADSNDMSKWEMVDFVGNKVNRLVLFRGTRSHRSLEYFGKDKHDGRLFQLFFFNEDQESRNAPRVASANPAPSQPHVLNAWDPAQRPKVCVLFFTTSRYEYLVPMLDSFKKSVDLTEVDTYTILFDDYPLRRDENLLRELASQYRIDQLVLNEDNLGYSLTWKKAWSMVPADADFVWHQEEDFVFNRPVNVRRMIQTMMDCPVPLNQLVLKRQRWYEEGDFVERIETGQLGQEVRFDDQCLIVHHRNFNANPCVYPRWVIEESYDHNPQESVIVDKLREKYPERYCAIAGSRTDEAAVSHIGQYNQGKKVLEGEPGWSHLQQYDPNKQYDAKHHLKEWGDR